MTRQWRGNGGDSPTASSRDAILASVDQLVGTVRAEQPVGLSGIDREARIVDHGAFAVALGQASALEHEPDGRPDPVGDSATSGLGARGDRTHRRYAVCG